MRAMFTRPSVPTPTAAPKAAAQAAPRGGLAAAVLLAAALALPGAATTPAAAQQMERIGDFTDWSAFKAQENGDPVCFVVSRPKQDEGNYTNRGDIYAMVAQRPAEDRLDEATFIAGYTFREGSPVEVTIGDNEFVLFTQNDGAWAPDDATNRALVQAMIRGLEMTVEGTSSRGTDTRDTYSLRGFTAAYEAARQACGL
jgi:hypothetical protein